MKGLNGPENMREFTFQLLQKQQIIERQKEPCADDPAAQAFARQIAQGLQKEGWVSDLPGSSLSVLDEPGKEIFQEQL